MGKKTSSLIFLSLGLTFSFTFAESVLKNPPNPTFGNNSLSTNEENIPPAREELKTPPAPSLGIKPPKSLEEALKRIPDYLIFKQIVPPVISQDQLMKSFFGKYSDFIQKILEANQTKEAIEAYESKNISKESLQKIIDKVAKVVSYEEKNSNFSNEITTIPKEEINQKPSKGFAEANTVKENRKEIPQQQKSQESGIFKYVVGIGFLLLLFVLLFFVIK